MIVKPELVKRIREYFNLNIYETKVWLALLSRGIASAGEIADLSGVPRSRTYDVLESLEKQGFAMTKIGKPVKYIAIKPTEVIEKMKIKVMNDAQEKVGSLVTLKDTQEYLELEQLHNVGITPIKSHELTGSVRGRTNVIAKIRELLENAEKEALICTTVSDFEDKARALLPAVERLKSNNIKLRISLSGDPERIRRLNAQHGLGAKQADNSSRIFIADRKEAFFSLTPETSEEELGIWMNAPFFTGFLHSIISQNLKN